MFEIGELVIQFFGLMIRGVFLVIGAIFECAANLFDNPPDIGLSDGISSLIEAGCEAIGNLWKQKADNDPPT